MPGFTNEFENNGARYVAVFVAVDAYFFESEEEFAIRKAEHAEGFLVADAMGDGVAGGGFEIGD